jgi:hypothetical protein
MKSAFRCGRASLRTVLVAFAALGLASLAKAGAQAGAPPIVYGDAAAFAQGACAQPLAPFPVLGLVALPGFVHPHEGLLLEPLAPARSLSTLDTSAAIAGAELALAGPEHLRVRSLQPLWAIGFELEQLGPGPSCGPSPSGAARFSAELWAGAQLVGQFEFDAPAPGAGAAFIGVQASAPFDRLELREGGAIDACDELIGAFWTSSCAPVHPYGSPTLGTGDFEAELSALVVPPQVGLARFGINGIHLLGGAPAWLVLGYAPAQLPLFGIELAVDPQRLLAVLPLAVSGSAGVGGIGVFEKLLPIPPLPELAGLSIHAQALVLDPAGPQGFAASAGLAFDICP